MLVYLTIMLAIPKETDLFSGSTNLKIQATHGIADMQVNHMVTNNVTTKPINNWHFLVQSVNSLLA